MGVDLENQVKRAAWRVGPFRIKSTLFFNEAGFDSNIYRGTASESVKDYTFTAGPGLNIYLPLKKKVVFSIYESPQYVHYFQTERERSWNNYLSGKVHFILNKFFITAGWGHSSARQRWNTEIDIRPRRKEESLSGSLLWQFSKRISYFLSFRKLQYDYESISYEDFNLAERLNRKENYLNLTTYYQISYRTRFFADLEYSRYNFESLSSSKDSRSHAAYGGFDFSPTGRVRGRIHIGYKTFDVLDPRAQDYKGIVGDTQISIKAFRLLSLRTSYRRNIQFSLWYDNNYYLEKVLGAGASFYLFRKIRLDYDTFAGRNHYPNIGEFGTLARQEREDLYRIHSAGIYFKVRKGAGLGVVFSHWVRDSNLDSKDAKRNFIGLNLTYDF